MTKPSPKFRRIIQAAEGGTEIIPILSGYLESGKLPDPLTVKVRGGTGDRPPDGWFHPSEHPEMAERQLYLYLTEPEAWEPEPFEYTIKMSALIGSVVHEIVETALIDLGYLIKPKGGFCPACGKLQPTNCREHGAADEETGSRGHMDGMIDMGDIPRGFELKTCHPRAIHAITNNDLAAFRAKWPYYYAQVQEYMRMTGLASYKVLFWGMGNPWAMREFTIDADPGFHFAVKSRYLAARQAVERKELPMACCNPGSAKSKICPARTCPVKSM